MNLARDQRGAVLVVGLFASAFLIGILYFVLGIGGALHQRAVLQDAADSGAYTLAIMGARAMNLMALLNMVEAALAALVAGLWGIVAGATAGIIYAAAKVASGHLSYKADVVAGGILFTAAVGTLWNISDKVDQTMQAAYDAQDYLRDHLLEDAEQEAGKLIADNYTPPVVGHGFAWPIRKMAVDRSYSFWVCVDKAYEPAYKMALQSFGKDKGGFPHDDTEMKADLAGIADVSIECPLDARGMMKTIDGFELGDEPFQVRYFVVGQPLNNIGESGVKVATWRIDEAGGRVVELRDALSRVNFAEGEYYFDGPESSAMGLAPHRAMMWEMGWKGRLRRFRFPEGGLGGFAGRCAEKGGDGGLCGKLSSLYESLGAAVVH